MISKNKVFALSSLALLAATLGGCGGKTADLTIWCPAVDGQVMDALVKNFKAANPDYADKVFSVVATHAEGDVQADVKKDKTVAGDVFCLADDNIRAAVDADTLLKLDDADKTAVATSDGKDAVDACSIDGDLYGYPYRADNSTLLIYNKKIVSDEQAKTLDGILAACAANNAQFYWDLANGWYNPAPFWGNGVTQKLTKDDKGIEQIDTTLYSTKGVEAAEALMATYFNNKTSFQISSDQATIEAGFADGKAGACIFWNDTATIEAKIVAAGGEMGVAHLPSITIGSKQVEMKSFLGYKAIAINNYVVEKGEETVTLAKKFAKYLASKEAQEIRIQLGYGPSNLEVAGTSEAKTLPWVAAINAQRNLGGTVGQAANVTGNFWDPMATIGTQIKNATKLGDWGTYGTAKKMLKSVVTTAGWVATEFIEN